MSNFTVRCSKCACEMTWFATGAKSGYWKCQKCPRTFAGVGHDHQHKLKCPYCSKILDAATAVDGTDAKPKYGDVSVCIGCCNLLVFMGGCETRQMSPDDFDRLPKQVQLELSDTQKACRRVALVQGAK